MRSLRTAFARNGANPIESLGKRIREAKMMKIPYVLVVGEKEEQAGTVNVNERMKEESVEISLDAFVKKIKEEIAQRAL